MVRKQVLDNGGWFDLDLAQSFLEKTFFDGSASVSANTGSQSEHQKLYVTAHGAYVLYSWSNWEDVPDRWQQLDEAAAHDWLIRNEHFDAVPKGVLQDREI